MTASRFGGFAAAAVAGLAVMFLTTGNASAEETSTPSTSETPSSVPPTTAPATDLAASTTVAACEITTADVDGGTATFTVGPDGCTTQVGPISFSTYELPGGEVLPYEDQVLIAHAAGNGSFYGAGSYTLTASLGDAINWQSDLYFGESDNQPPHPHMIDVDAQVGQVAPASGTVAPTTAPTTAPPTTTPQTTVALAPPVTVVANASATVVVIPSEQAAQAGPTTTTTVGPVSTLPATGSNSTPVMLTTAGALTVVGLATRRLARGH